MTDAQRLPNGDLVVPVARHSGGVILDGTQVVSQGSSEWSEWVRAAKAEGVVIPLSSERSTGQELFDAMTKDEQDAQFGPDIAEALRRGDITLADLVHREGGFITAKPAQDLSLGS